MTTRNLLAVTSAGEATFGLIILMSPPVLVGLLFGAASTGVATVVTRLAGIILMAFGAACWPGREHGALTRKIAQMLGYNCLATLYLGGLAIDGVWVGALLWPAVMLHLVVTILCARAWLGEARLAQA